ncbi:phosphatidylglycerophosphatase A [Candidatus Dependentiae bacterium]|nr:phosphatidylglycerophosphatase A [Candidatus Dependentiae bacterium]
MFGNKSPISYLVTTGFGVGYLPWMPGTWASLVAVVFLFLLPDVSCLVQLAIVAALLSVGLLTVDRVQQDAQTQDPSWIVIDEYFGMAIAVLGVPKELGWYALAFVLFRFFDIKKIFPINHLEQLPGSWGVMLDDGMAGIFTVLLVQILIYLMNSSFL